MLLITTPEDLFELQQANEEQNLWLDLNPRIPIRIYNGERAETVTI
jgi:hypothetical protein